MTVPERNRWDNLWNRLGAKDASTFYSVLTARYAEPHRAYHNLRHIMHCLEEFDAARDLARDPAAVELAIWYHDAIYDPRSNENETRSAGLASQAIRGAGLHEDLNNRVTQLILATKGHDAFTDEDAPVMVDVDLSILGQMPVRFDEYERQIRKEYDWVSDDAFAFGRASVLKSFMDRPTIYWTNFFQKKYEQQARSNLKESLSKLEGRTAKGGSQR